MPEVDQEGKRYQTDKPQTAPGFFLKGAHQLDWGMKNRLARTFNPKSGRTVMLAVDHGYFQGPTTGLERIDLSIVPLLPQCDALFCTRGILRSLIPADCAKPMVLRASGGPSILRDELSDEQIAMDMDDAVRLNAAGVGIQVFIGGEYETRSIHNMTKLVDAGLRAGIPVMGVTAVGKNMTRNAQYFRLACRIIAELGAQYVKTYYVDEDFETVTASCPVPIVMAGGKKLPELDALTMAYNAVQQGAAGVDMGRNIFQSDAPKAMLAAVNAVVHENMKPKEAFELYGSLKAEAWLSARRLRAFDPPGDEARQRRPHQQHHDQPARLHRHHERQVDLAGGGDDRHRIRSARAGGQIGRQRIDTGGYDQQDRKPATQARSGSAPRRRAPAWRARRAPGWRG